MKFTLTYRVERERSAGGKYITDKLTVRESRCEDTASAIAGCVDNAAGYQSPDAARQMLRVFTALRADGHDRYYDTSWDSISVGVAYLVFNVVENDEPEYCAPTFDWPSNYAHAQRALKLFERIGKRVEKQHAASGGYLPHDVGNGSFISLQRVTAALDAMGAVRVERWTRNHVTFDVKYDPDKASEAA